MPHDFLTAMHSSVIGVSNEKLVGRPQVSANALTHVEKNIQENVDDRHRTVGVSMSPQLRARAAQRAQALGLPFSRYVQWCVEAELDGSSLSDRFKL